MKKTKTITIRMSLEDYKTLKSDYNFEKNVLHNKDIKTFSDYIRNILNEIVDYRR